MPTAKKQPSGQWKVRAYSHTDENGKQHYRSFTAPTKQEAEQLAAKFASGDRRAACADITVKEAISRYVEAKDGVLSPKTIREYKGMSERYYKGIGAYKIRKLTNEQVQRWVSGMNEKVSAKTVRNAYGLFVSAIALFLPDKTFRVTLPARPKRRISSPSDDQVNAIYNAAPDWMKICIALAGFKSLRRGEIAALTYGDIDGLTIHITKDMVQDKDNKWVIKDMPKTSESVRDIDIPPQIVDLIGTGAPDARIIDKTPNTITLAFIRLRNRLNIPIRFHSLRSYYASIGAILGIPDIYIARGGGWRAGSKVLKETYQHTIDSMEKQYSDVMSAHLKNVLNTDNPE